MFVKRFSSESHFLPAYIVLWAMLLWIDGFIYYKNIEIVTIDNYAPFYKIVSSIFKNAPFLNVLTAFVFVVVQAFMLNNLFTSKNLMERNSYLPALVYITLMSFSVDMLSLNPVLFANFFLIITLNKIFDVYNEDEVYLEVFNSGIFIGIATMFYFPVFVFYLFLISALAVYYLINLRGVLASLLGFATPALYVWVYYFLTGQVDYFIGIYFSDIKLLSAFYIEYSDFILIFWAVILFFGIIALMKVYLNYVRGKPVRIRKRYSALSYFILFSITSYFFVLDFSVQHFAIMVISISPLFAVFFQEIKRRFWKELVFTIIIILILMGKLSTHGLIQFL